MCRVRVSSEGRRSFIAIGLSNDGKWAFKKDCMMTGCHAVVHCEVRRAVFEPCFRTVVLTVEARIQTKQSFLHGDFQCVMQD